MVYIPSVPTSGSENISVSQPKITENFQQLNTIFAEDHFTWNDATSAKRGLHRKITFPTPLLVDPPTSTNTGSFYTKADVKDTSARPQLYFQNVTGGGRQFQITNRFIDASSEGFLMLPNGTNTNASIIIMWGAYSGPFNSSTPIPVTFHTIGNYVGAPVGFPHACFNVQLTIGLASGDVGKTLAVTQGTVSSTGFSFNSSNSSVGFVYWFAIGN